MARPGHSRGSGFDYELRMFIFLYSVISYLLFVASFLDAVGWMGNVPLVPRTIDGQPGTPALQALLIDLALLSLFAVQHSVMARPAFKKVWTRIVPPAAERATYVLLSSLCLLAICTFWQSLPGTIWRLSGNAAAAAWLLYGLGWTIAFTSTFMIDHFELFGLRQGLRHFLQRSTPELKFRERGLYRVVRHPIMLGFVIAFWSAPWMTSGRLAFALVTTAYVLVALQLEERDLTNALGAQYDAYRERVPMLLPRLFR
jgi:protein-S-isoprenylcysteine O-methyltransferase Ste14